MDYFFFGGFVACFPRIPFWEAFEMSKQLIAHIENMSFISCVSSFADVSTTANKFSFSANFNASVNNTARLDSFFLTMSNLVPTKMTFLGGPEKSLSTIDLLLRAVT